MVKVSLVRFSGVCGDACLALVGTKLWDELNQQVGIVFSLSRGRSESHVTSLERSLQTSCSRHFFTGQS